MDILARLTEVIRSSLKTQRQEFRSFSGSKGLTETAQVIKVQKKISSSFQSKVPILQLTQMGKMPCILPPACNHTSPQSGMKWNRNLEAVRLWTRVVTSFIYKKQKKKKHGYHEKKQNKNITKTLKSSTQKNAPRHSHVTLTTRDTPTLLIYSLLLKR